MPRSVRAVFMACPVSPCLCVARWGRLPSKGGDGCGEGLRRLRSCFGRWHAGKRLMAVQWAWCSFSSTATPQHLRLRPWPWRPVKASRSASQPRTHNAQRTEPWQNTNKPREPAPRWRMSQQIPQPRSKGRIHGADWPAAPATAGSGRQGMPDARADQHRS